MCSIFYRKKNCKLVFDSRLRERTNYIQPHFDIPAQQLSTVVLSAGRCKCTVGKCPPNENYDGVRRNLQWLLLGCYLHLV